MDTSAVRVQRKHLTTNLVVGAIEICGFRAYEVLCNCFPPKVVIAAFRREVKRGIIDYGVCITRPWLVR